MTCTNVLHFVLPSVTSTILLYATPLVDTGDHAVISSRLQQGLLLPSTPLPTATSTTTKSGDQKLTDYLVGGGQGSAGQNDRQTETVSLGIHTTFDTPMELPSLTQLEPRGYQS